MQPIILTSTALLVSVVGAQSTAVVPANFTASDAPTLGGVAGFTRKQRQQIVLAASELGALRGHAITRVEFRRDGQYSKALQGGHADLVVRLASTPRTLDGLDTTFAANLGGSPAVVVQATVALPASPALAHRNEPTWATPYAVGIPFSLPFTYTTDNLVVDIEGANDLAQSTPWWPVDYVPDLIAGNVLSVGSACGIGSDLGVAREQLVLGGTARFVAGGPPSSLSALMLAAARVPPIDLAFLGAPGCRLHVLPVTTLSAGASAGERGSPGTANHELHLPGIAPLAGASFATQALSVWSDTGGVHLATSAALEVALAGAFSTLPGATIDSVFVAPNEPFPAVGRVRRTRMPVVRLSYQ